MFKNIMLFFAFSVAVVASSGVSALPIQNADAFSSGDNKAALEISTGLVWMDFGVTNNQSMGSILSQLGTTYSGWRLPTQSEVMHLWANLFSGYQGWFSFGEFGAVSGANFENEFNEIHSILGANGLGNYSLYENGELTYSEQIFGGIGLYALGEGSYGAAMMYSPTAVNSPLSYTALTYVSYDPSAWDWQGEFSSTLLVKDGAASQVSEPSTLMLLVMGLVGFFVAKRRAKA